MIYIMIHIVHTQTYIHPFIQYTYIHTHMHTQTNGRKYTFAGISIMILNIIIVIVPSRQSYRHTSTLPHVPTFTMTASDTQLKTEVMPQPYTPHIPARSSSDPCLPFPRSQFITNSLKMLSVA